jgi:starch synthase
MVASEAAPFAKTGGLADVLGSLPSALIKQGADVRVIMPKYRTIVPKLRESINHKCYIYSKVGWRNLYCGIEQAEYNGVTYYFIDNEFYFGRDNLYGYNDDPERYAYFCRAVLDAIPYLDFNPDILHCHDWQAGMVPVLLEAQYRHQDRYRDMKTVFTIHNLKYQGIYGMKEMKEWFSLTDDYFTADKLEFYGAASFMKGGLTYSHLITTVSNTYAEEIKNPFFGERLEGILNARSGQLRGIVNGIDYVEFDPQKDPLIYQSFSKSKLAGKVANKLALQKELGLSEDENIPMIGLISRFYDQKGLDLVDYIFDEIMTEDVQFVLLGTGDAKYEYSFREKMKLYPGRVSANIKFDNTLAHKIYAASDLFLMPSLFEPCGLGQLISLRYGTLPIVRETGGLKDTVLSYNEVTGEGNGFSFTNYNAHDMLYTIRTAVSLCRKKAILTKLRKAAMSCDYSWNSSAGKYMDLYHELKPEL